MLVAYQTPGSVLERFQAISRTLGDRVDELLAECDGLSAFADENYLPFMLPLYKRQRQMLFAVLDQVPTLGETSGSYRPPAVTSLSDGSIKSLQASSILKREQRLWAKKVFINRTEFWRTTRSEWRIKSEMAALQYPV
jgi:hypothetical protein